jgi:hypothetical protein
VFIDGGTVYGVDERWMKATGTPFVCLFNRGTSQPASWYYKRTAVGIRRGLTGRLVLGRQSGDDYHFVEFDRLGTVWGEVGIRIGVNEAGVDRTIHSQEVLTLPPPGLSEEEEVHIGYRIEVVVTPDPDDVTGERAWIEGNLHVGGRRLPEAGYPVRAAQISAAVCNFNHRGFHGFGSALPDTVFTYFSSTNT